MSAMSNIYTTAMVISDLEDRMNELDELCVAVNEWDDDFPCDCDTHNEIDFVWSQLKELHKEWSTFPVQLRNEAWQMIYAQKKVNA